MVTSVPLGVGAERDLASLVRTSDGQILTQPLVWTSSNERAATVSASTGNVRAVGQGSAVVTATLAGDPSARVGIEVTVEEKPTVLLVKIDPDMATMVIGDKIHLTGQVRMADGQVNGNVTWGSSDDTIATVNPTTGDLSAVRVGRVTVVASYTADPRYKGLAEVEVVADRSKIPPSAAPSSVVFKPGATPIPIGTDAPLSLSSAAPSSPPSSSGSSTPAPVSTTPKATLTGVVLNAETNAGEPGVTVTLAGGTSVTTGADGGYSFSVPLGTAKVTATKTRFEAKDNEASIVIGQANVSVKAVPIALKPTHWTNQLSGVSKALNDVFAISETHAWIAGDGGTLLRTTDGGDNWQPAQSAPVVDFETVFFIDSLTGWAAGDNGKVLKSQDGGSTWTPLAVAGAGPPGNPLSAQISGETFNDIQFLDANTGWAVTDKAIYGTKDGGQAWTRSENARGKCLHFRDASHGVAGNDSSIFITQSSGDTWQSTNVTYGFRFDQLVMLSNTEVWGFYFNGRERALKSLDGGLSFVAAKEPGAEKATGFSDVASRSFAPYFDIPPGSPDFDAFFNYPNYHFASPRVGWVVGSSGRIKRY